MITICIPTKNRPEFLSRLLHYFQDTGCKYPIFIGDSSDNFTETLNIIESLKLNITHFECPGLSVAEAVHYLAKAITTSYAVGISDDDFLCINGVDKCVEFLEKNSDYTAVHGRAIGTGIDESGPYGDIDFVHYYQLATLEADSGSQRLRDYLTTRFHVITFSVHRTEVFVAMFQDFTSQESWTTQPFTFDELIPSTISAVRGKIGEIDCLHVSRFGYKRDDFRLSHKKWIVCPEYPMGFKCLQDRLVKELMRQDNISKEKASETFNEIYESFLELYLVSAHKYDEKYNILPSLLTDSPYHKDFMPIYSSITKYEK